MAGGNHLFELFRGAIDDPARPFIETADGETVSFEQLFAASARLAHVLATLGVAPGDRVAVQVEKSWQTLALYLATLRAGAVYLPLNSAYTAAELSYFLSDAEPKLFVTDPARAEAAQAIAGTARIETLDQLGGGSLMTAAATAPDSFDDVARGAENLAAILYTSGTTGRSKGAMLSHDNLASNAHTLVAYWRFTPDDVLLHALPIFHIHGLFVATNVALLAGAKMLFLPRFDIDAVMQLIPRATTMMGVPTFYNRMITRPDLTPALCGNMRLFISGSAPLSAEVHKTFRTMTGHAILERYGMTETGMNTSNPYDGERRAGTVGFPLPGVDLCIADPESGKTLPTGEIGVIQVRGPNVFSGYWRMPEKTAEEFRDSWFITGDLGFIDDRGYVSIVGRDKDLIISGGLNVYPAEIEAAIDEVPGVAECAVIGVPHADFGEAVVAVVAPRDGAALTEGDICTPLAQSLANFKRPKRVVFTDALPRNTMGKIEKARLRDAHRDLFA